MNVIDVDIKNLKPYKNNPRNNKDAVDPVANSIKEFGFKVPLVIDKDYNIICGHTRYLASKKLNLDKVPCVVADDLTEEQIKAFRLADNKVSEIASWEFDLLDNELENIVNIDMSDFNFDLSENNDEEEIIQNEDNFNYKEQYGVIVMCKDEQEQEAIYNRLVEEGFDCKVVAT